MGGAALPRAQRNTRTEGGLQTCSADEQQGEEEFANFKRAQKHVLRTHGGCVCARKKRRFEDVTVELKGRRDFGRG